MSGAEQVAHCRNKLFLQFPIYQISWRSLFYYRAAGRLEKILYVSHCPQCKYKLHFLQFVGNDATKSGDQFAESNCRHAQFNSNLISDTSSTSLAKTDGSLG